MFDSHICERVILKWNSISSAFWLAQTFSTLPGCICTYWSYLDNPFIPAWHNHDRWGHWNSYDRTGIRLADIAVTKALSQNSHSCWLISGPFSPHGEFVNFCHCRVDGTRFSDRWFSWVWWTRLRFIQVCYSMYHYTSHPHPATWNCQLWVYRHYCFCSSLE